MRDDIALYILRAKIRKSSRGDIGDDLLTCAVGDTAKYRDFFAVLIGDNHVVDAGLAVEHLLLGDSGEDVAHPRRGGGK